MIRLVAVTALATVVAGCNNDRVARLESDVRALKQDVSQFRKVNALELQSKCATDSKAWFRENWERDKETMLLDYSAHYNPASNKCFIEVYYNWSLGTARSTVLNQSTTLSNVYENSQYGRLALRETIGDFPTPRKITDCWVVGTKCTTVEEYRSLATKLMEH